MKLIIEATVEVEVPCENHNCEAVKSCVLRAVESGIADNLGRYQTAMRVWCNEKPAPGKHNQTGGGSTTDTNPNDRPSL